MATPVRLTWRINPDGSKSLSHASDPNRDDQFRHINATVNAFIKANQAMVSVDTRKKELVGKCLNKGKRWRKKGTPDEVEDHDLYAIILPELANGIK